MQSLSRRDLFLRRSKAKERSYPFPPWALSKDLFLTTCDQCGACIDACPEGILLQDPTDSFPGTDFNSTGCTFCKACVEACPTGALKADDTTAPWAHRIAIAASCLSEQGITCRVCEESCEPRAIRFALQTGGRALPVLNEDDCTGCGFCISACPVQAITLEPHSSKEATQ